MRPITEIYEDLRQLGVVTSQRQMSTLMGKTPSWFSSSQTRKRKPTLDALTCGYVAISDIYRRTAARMKTTTDDEELGEISRHMGILSKVGGEIWLEIQSIIRSRHVAVRPTS